MDSAVLGLEPSGCGCCAVPVFRQKFALEDAIGSHAFAPVEASKRATIGIPLGCPLVLPVYTGNSVRTLKVYNRSDCITNPNPNPYHEFYPNTEGFTGFVNSI
jgi:hypothetical protein